MLDILIEYLSNLFKGIPLFVYEVGATVFIVGTVLLVLFFGHKKGLRFTSVLFFVTYIFLLFCSTVVFRTYREPPGMNLLPFWSYFAIGEGDVKLMYENLMNVLVFIPVGISITGVFQNVRCRVVALVCCGVSLLIEMMQYAFERGFVEVDDVIHNVIGGMIGYGLYIGIGQLRKRLKVRTGLT